MDPEVSTPDVLPPEISASEVGHARRIFLVVVDETAEMRVALRYASLRARHTNGLVALLYVTEPAEAEWSTIADMMHQEAWEKAEEIVVALAGEAFDLSGTRPVIHIREGDRRDELLALIDEDPLISILVLAAGLDTPGPLIQYLAGKMIGRLRVPLTIVPGRLTDAEINALC